MSEVQVYCHLVTALSQRALQDQGRTPVCNSAAVALALVNLASVVNGPDTFKLVLAFQALWNSS